MKYRKTTRGYAIRLETGEDVLESLNGFAEEKQIGSATVSGIGAASSVICGRYNADEGNYLEETFTGDLEILALSGNISWVDGRAFAHVHIVLSDDDQNAVGGHLFAATVSATAEIFLDVFDEKLVRNSLTDHALKLLDL